ncbi:unnamed protein product [Blepharisma stoltei]|uniref:Uncharacterized protein n=1 Tax=Blepharisma stoltei TaxID=1481888 RepID=A0AAU9IFC3_9CILI|nr:unnamed protein product [Blepharisma stoltei]
MTGIEQSSVWVIKNLWKPLSICQLKIRILDTVFIDPEELSGYRWIYTDENYNVVKKATEEASRELIVQHFLSPYDFPNENDPLLEELTVGHLINESSYLPLTKTYLITTILEQLISWPNAIQMWIPTLGDSEHKICVKIKLESGRYIKRFVKKDKTGKKINLTAKNLCNELDTSSDSIMKALHRNTSYRIKKTEFLFILDKTRSLWFMGTRKCKVYEIPSSLKPSLILERSPSVMKRLPVSKSTTQILRSKSVSKKICQGDFCNYNLKGKYDQTDPEVNYDEILKTIRLAYTWDGKNEANKVRLGIAGDYLQKERRRFLPKLVLYEMPLYIIYLGQSILSRLKFLPINGQIQDLEVESFLSKKSLKKTIKNLGFDSCMSSQLHGQKMYENVKVCERCYDIYNVIRHYKHKLNSPDPRQAKTQLISTRPSLSNFKTSDKMYSSTLGKINTDNINDLLIDMNAALIEKDNEISLKAKKDLTLMLSSRTEYSRQKSASKIQKKQSVESSTVEMESKDNKLESVIAVRFFPNEKNKVKFKDKEELAQKSYRNYLERLKAGKISRPRLII